MGGGGVQLPLESDTSSEVPGPPVGVVVVPFPAPVWWEIQRMVQSVMDTENTSQAPGHRVAATGSCQALTTGSVLIGHRPFVCTPD